jgi:hypothetical protein
VEGCEPIEAKLVDTSPSGLGLEAGVGLDSGTAVRLACSGIEIGMGKIQHCRPSGDRFLIGVALLPP